MKEEYRSKQYVLRVKEEHQAASDSLYALLSSFECYRSAVLPHIASVTTRSAQQERSLLETLATLPQISFHEAVRRKTQGENHD